ncbi:MAG: hypothetical protein IT384_32095 [Deltaproteobacteria bacterium]|nr:hypothetical protein [Deltaproteobacteria bacterium]
MPHSPLIERCLAALREDERGALALHPAEVAELEAELRAIPAGPGLVSAVHELLRLAELLEGRGAADVARQILHLAATATPAVARQSEPALAPRHVLRDEPPPSLGELAKQRRRRR